MSLLGWRLPFRCRYVLAAGYSGQVPYKTTLGAQVLESLVRVRVREAG